MLKCLIALTSLLSAAVLAAPAWTWVDNQGRRHYSDRPVEGATQIELAGPQTFSGGSTPATPAPQTQNQPPAAPQYSVLDIISPSNEETISNTGGNLTMEVAVYPPLRVTDRIDVILDGRPQQLGSRSLSVTIPEVFRGEHTIQAVILGEDGRELLRSGSVTVFVRQTSLLTPPPQRAPLPPPPRPPASN
jgi:hypothetical protein